MTMNSANGFSFKWMNMGNWKCFLILLFVFGFEELLRLQFFKCPCTNHSTYSFAMVSAPALFLLGAGFCSSTNYWEVFSTRKNIASYKLRINYSLKSLPSLFEPFLPVAAFIVLVLLKGEFYACAMASNSNACLQKKELTSRMKGLKPTADELDKLYSQSQLLGCGVLAGVTIFAVGLILIRRCFFENGKIPDTEEYYLLENDLFMTTFRERLRQSITKEVTRDIDEAFDDVEGKSVHVLFKEIRDHFRCKKSLDKVGRFARIPHDEDCEDTANVRIIDATL